MVRKVREPNQAEHVIGQLVDARLHSAIFNVSVVTCLNVDTCLTAYLRVTSSIPTWSHPFVKIYHEIISTAIIFPLADSRRDVVSFKRKYLHIVLVNCFVKLVQEKRAWFIGLTVPT